MQQAIETRELITLDGLGVLFRGTYHKASDPSSLPGSQVSPRNRTGVLFLNSLSVPRASTGDSAVYWADSIAMSGYPSFRFDLPGLGDTCGETPAQLLDFINAGGYSEISAAKVKELVECFNLSGVVIVGHCAGAVSAIHAAADCKECKGLILMDPYFHLTKAVRPKARMKLSDWARRSRFGGLLSDVYDRARDVRRFLRRNKPPGNANFSLISRWKQVASSGLPILILKAPGLKAATTKPRLGEFDYLKHVLGLAGRKSQVAVELIQNTDHSFANRVGRVGVQQQMYHWLSSRFPLPASGELVVDTLHSTSHESETHFQHRERCLPA